MLNVKGVEIIKEMEGFRAKKYICPAGKPTIGYGHVIRNNEKYLENAELTKYEATKLLLSDAAIAERELLQSVNVPLNENQKSALISFIYNLGITKFNKSTLLKKLNAGDYQGAADELLRWTKAYVGGQKVELPGLVKRRKLERGLFLEKPTEFEISVDDIEAKGLDEIK